MEIVFQEKNGELQLELWLGEERVCVCTEVTNEKAIVNMVARSETLGHVVLALNAGDETKHRLLRIADIFEINNRKRN